MYKSRRARRRCLVHVLHVFCVMIDECESRLRSIYIKARTSEVLALKVARESSSLYTLSVNSLQGLIVLLQCMPFRGRDSSMDVVHCTVALQLDCYSFKSQENNFFICLLPDLSFFISSFPPSFPPAANTQNSTAKLSKHKP